MASLKSVDKKQTHSRNIKRGDAPFQALQVDHLIRLLFGHELSFAFGFDGPGSNAVYTNVVLAHSRARPRVNPMIAPLEAM